MAMKRYSLQKRVSKFAPKKFYKIDSRIVNPICAKSPKVAKSSTRNSGRILVQTSPLLINPNPAKLAPKIWLVRSLFPGKTFWRGRTSTVDLLVLTSLDQLLFVLKKYFPQFTKQPILIRRSTVLSPSPSVRVPWLFHFLIPLSRRPRHKTFFCWRFGVIS